MNNELHAFLKKRYVGSGPPISHKPSDCKWISREKLEPSGFNCQKRHSLCCKKSLLENITTTNLTYFVG
ncbi:hypothetical protein HanIR_Chr15g0768461 [Helianthus annuus]|nr:hypothetical protein HanIR_Chr15g0768461 [Helianthus annuus]